MDMGLGRFLAMWSIRGIARTQFRLFRLTQQNPGIPETVIAPHIFVRRMKRVTSPPGQEERIAAYFDANGPVKTLRDACHAIAVVEFKIHPLDEQNVAYLSDIIDAELQRLGYAEE
jgi:hypothetical protein